MRPEPAPRDAAKLHYRKGRRYPRAIAWFGARSFWGHLWHLMASVIATEDIDSRDWMVAEDRAELTKRIADELGGDGDAASLTEALEADLWIDFVADTGDDSSVSAAVARMLFARYEVDDPDAPGTPLELPRGHVLLFGGDTAYPVATDLEIHNRVTVPWNKVLRTVQDGARRVLLGVPGNHDWYAGLDGFGRMFRRRRGHVDRQTKLATDEVDRKGQVGHLVQWIEAFRVGHYVVKRPTLPLEGYAPVQSASYWSLRLAPKLDLWGPDRQLRSVDFHQATYFGAARDHDLQGIVLCLADPVRAFLEPNEPGVKILEALDLSLEDDGMLVLTGDTHHFCREEVGRGTHVTAGGGGAFLHPARIRRGADVKPPAAEFPGPRTSLALALRVPLAIANGRSGFLVHAGIAALYAPAYGIGVSLGRASVAGAAVTSLVAFVVLFLIGGFRSDRAIKIGALALAFGASLGFLPFALQAATAPLAKNLALWLRFADQAVPFAIAVWVATALFGLYLATLTMLGLESHQAFAALAHPGYKHFVRLRVKRDGARIDGWVLGKVDPLAKGDRVVLVDRFRWTNPAHTRDEEARRAEKSR